MQYNLEWDPEKAKENWQKHGVRFEQAATVFRDPKAMTLYDDEHSVTEERWITMGISANNILLVVHHTFREETMNTATIRLISSRKAIQKERQQYITGE